MGFDSLDLDSLMDDDDNLSSNNPVHNSEEDEDFLSSIVEGIKPSTPTSNSGVNRGPKVQEGKAPRKPSFDIFEAIPGKYDDVPTPINPVSDSPSSASSSDGAPFTDFNSLIQGATEEEPDIAEAFTPRKTSSGLGKDSTGAYDADKLFATPLRKSIINKDEIEEPTFEDAEEVGLPSWKPNSPNAGSSSGDTGRNTPSFDEAVGGNNGNSDSGYGDDSLSMSSDHSRSSGGGFKKLLVWIVAIALIVIGLWFAYNTLFADKGSAPSAPPSTETQQSQEQEEVVIPEPVEEEGQNNDELSQSSNEELGEIVGPGDTVTPVDTELVNYATALVKLGEETLSVNDKVRLPELSSATKAINPEKATDSEVELLAQSIISATRTIAPPSNTLDTKELVLGVSASLQKIAGKDTIALVVTTTAPMEVSASINVNGTVTSFPVSNIQGVATFTIEAPSSGAFAYIVEGAGGDSVKTGVLSF